MAAEIYTRRGEPTKVVCVPGPRFAFMQLVFETVVPLISIRSRPPPSSPQPSFSPFFLHFHFHFSPVFLFLFSPRSSQVRERQFANSNLARAVVNRSAKNYSPTSRLGRVIVSRVRDQTGERKSGRERENKNRGNVITMFMTSR